MFTDFRRIAIRRLLISSTLLLASCTHEPVSRARAGNGGVIVIATTSDPDALFPPVALNMEARQATELIYEYLADVGAGMNTIGDAGFTKELASGWTWSRDSMSIAFHIDAKARWHDGAPVTSRDVAFSFSVYTDSTVASVSGSELADIDSVSAADPATAVFWFNQRTQHQFFDAASQMLILPAHLLASVPRDSLRVVATRTPPVGSGRFQLAAWERGSRFELRAVEGHYRGRANPDRLIWTITPEYQSAVVRLLGGEADVFPNVRPESVTLLTAGEKFRIVSLPGMDYVFMAFNFRDPVSPGRPHPLFQSAQLRRAITMSLDRVSMAANLFDTLAKVSIGPTVRAYPVTDTSIVQVLYDPVMAQRVLDSLGWRRESRTGFRSKNGRRLEFTVLVPVSSLSRMRIAVLIQEQLRRVGIDMRIDQMDYSAFTARQQKRSFDAVLASWHLGSSPVAATTTWTTAAAKKGGLNYGGYTNSVFDALLDSAVSASTPRQARDYFRRAHQVIVDDAPAVWLYEPRTLIAVNRRIETTPMRPNAWWLDIGSWKVQSATAVSRDADTGSASH
jgi:peptide/nickel transport system substrate-binding protein